MLAILFVLDTVTTVVAIRARYFTSILFVLDGCIVVTNFIMSVLGLTSNALDDNAAAFRLMILARAWRLLRLSRLLTRRQRIAVEDLKSMVQAQTDLNRRLNTILHSLKQEQAPRNLLTTATPPVCPP